tara:strand:+ start:322 stop:780 length:459 start_codon:yes stop_codon:yes gene_type:complete
LTESLEKSNTGYGSEELDKIVSRLSSTKDSRRKYEYVLWLAKKLPEIPNQDINDSIKVKGCVSQVFVLGTLKNGKITWQGYSDALITKGLLALLIMGLDNLTPLEILNININFVKETGLGASLTPSRANGFLNIFLNMKSQANKFHKLSALK